MQTSRWKEPLIPFSFLVRESQILENEMFLLNSTNICVFEIPGYAFRLILIIYFPIFPRNVFITNIPWVG